MGCGIQRGIRQYARPRCHARHHGHLLQRAYVLPPPGGGQTSPTSMRECGTRSSSRSPSRGWQSRARRAETYCPDSNATARCGGMLSRFILAAHAGPARLPIKPSSADLWAECRIPLGTHTFDLRAHAMASSCHLRRQHLPAWRPAPLSAKDYLASGRATRWYGPPHVDSPEANGLNASLSCVRESRKGAWARFLAMMPGQARMPSYGYLRLYDAPGGCSTNASNVHPRRLAGVGQGPGHLLGVAEMDDHPGCCRTGGGGVPHAGSRAFGDRKVAKEDRSGAEKVLKPSGRARSRVHKESSLPRPDPAQPDRAVRLSQPSPEVHEAKQVITRPSSSPRSPRASSS